MSLIPNLTLTLKQQPIQTGVAGDMNVYYGDPNEDYTYNNALSDAIGGQGWGNAVYIEPSRANNTMFLWEQGCRFANDTRNCTMACFGSEEAAKAVWSSADALSTLHNCLKYPILATAAVHGWLVEEPPGTDLLNHFGIIPGDMLPVNAAISPEDSIEAWPVVNGCLEELCDLLYGRHADEKCTASKKSTFNTSYVFGPGDNPWRPELILHTDLCDLGSRVANADLSGPGVMLSCMQQAMIIAAMWTILSLAPLLKGALSSLRDRWRAPAARRQNASPKSGKQTAALIAALQEFQRTQVFFFLALQVVSLLAVSNVQWLEASTYWQLLFNLFMLNTISPAGVYPIEEEGHLESFTLATSLGCVVLSYVTWIRSNHLNVNRERFRHSELNPTECGGINPLQYCISSAGSTLQDMLGGIYGYWTSGAALCMSLALALEKLFPAAFWRCWNTLPKKARRVLQVAIPLCAEMILLSETLRQFHMIYTSWADKEFEGRVWTVGQILGVGVFVPVFLEYAYLAWRGVEVSFSFRLPADYKVVKTDAGSVSADSSATALVNISRHGDQQSSAMQAPYELLSTRSNSNHHIAHEGVC